MKIDPETEISKIIDAVHIFRDKREKTIYKQIPIMYNTTCAWRLW